MRRIKTASKKFFVLGILLIILISISLLVQYSYFSNINIQNNEINIKKSREILGHEVNSELKLNAQMIESATEFISTNNWSEKEIELYFKKLIEINPTFNIIYYGDTNNNLINSSSWTPTEDYDLRKRGWYIKAIAEEGMVYSEAYVDTITGRIVIAISKPVYNKNKEVQGVVGGDIFIEDILELVQDAKSGEIGYSFLIDGQGNILAHPKYKYDSYSNLRNIEEIGSNILGKMKHKGTGEKQVILDEVEGYLAYQPIEGTDWIVGNFASLEEYNNIEDDLLRMFIITLVVIMITFGGFLFIQNKEFIKPLKLLEQNIEDINIGDKIDYRLELDEDDPFSSITKAINITLNKTEEFFRQQQEYQEELRASHEELEASYGQLAAMEEELREQYKELEKREKELYDLSYYDQLTGLYNRRFFEEELIRIDNGEHLPLTLIMADVNGLKLVNDSFGHKAGDELLRTVGNAMIDSCEGERIASRIGGDEFIIILPKMDEKEAGGIVKEIRRLARKSNPLNIELSVSFGIGTKYSNDEDISQVIKKVEDNMYSNKLVEGPSMRSKTIDTIVQALYEKNPREEAHSTRVSHICKEMGIQLGMSNEKIKELETVGLLHDIGKVAISDQVLEKPGPLNDEEWKQMKKHPEVGYRILSTTNEMAQIAGYVLAHHERCDGKGYPKGLNCDEIPIVSKIIAIADAYDAMISDRPYRKGLPEEVAIGEIIKNAGAQFDSELARVFVEKVLEKEWIEKI